MPSPSVATILNAHLERKGWTRYQLAKAVADMPGLGASAVYNILGGRTEPTLRQVAALHAALELSPEDALCLWHASSPSPPSPSPIEAAVRAYFDAHPPETLGCGSASCRIRPQKVNGHGPCRCHRLCTEPDDRGHALRTGLRLLGRLRALIEEDSPLPD